jgi:hypothetical protein
LVWYVIEIDKYEKINLENLGFTIQCQIINENLNCILLLPQKYFTYIEGLAGNFNGDYSDDLINLQTSQTVLIYSASNGTLVGNDVDILAACRSCKFIGKNK